MRVPSKQKALTLIELLLVLVMLSLIVVFTDSSLLSLLQKQSTQSSSQRFFADLQFARSEAIKRNQQVHVCPTLDATQCANEWSDMYLIYVQDKQRQTQPVEILRVNCFSKNLRITHSNHALISYNGDGSCLTRTTLWLQNGAHAQKVVIYDSGRARIEST